MEIENGDCSSYSNDGYQRSWMVMMIEVMLLHLIIDGDGNNGNIGHQLL